MNKTVIIINGKSGVGKDTLCNIVTNSKRHIAYNCSSIDPIKKIAKRLGWEENDKSDKAKKFLADLKSVSYAFNDYVLECLLEKYRVEFMPVYGYDVMFVHIKEPEQIAKFKAMIPNCKTLLVKSNRVEPGFDSEVDDDVENYDYDYVYHNDKPLDEVADDFMKFFEGQILGGGSKTLADTPTF